MWFQKVQITLKSINLLHEINSFKQPSILYSIFQPYKSILLHAFVTIIKNALPFTHLIPKTHLQLDNRNMCTSFSTTRSQAGKKVSVNQHPTCQNQLGLGFFSTHSSKTLFTLIGAKLQVYDNSNTKKITINKNIR